MQSKKYNIVLCSSFVFAGLFPATASASLVDLLITEVMANPVAVSDTSGEWFELFNPTQHSVNLEGIVISDEGANQHTISSGAPLLIDPGSYFVFARNGDTQSNGGFNADYVYSNFSLGNRSDQIILTGSGGESLRLDYSDGFVAAGQSSEMTGLPMTALNYGLTDAAFNYGLGDVGTPGAAGSFTPSAVPLPAAIWLFGSGLLGLTGISRGNRARS